MNAERRYQIFQVKPGKAMPIFVDPDDPKDIKAIQTSLKPAFPFAIRSTGRELSQAVRQVTKQVLNDEIWCGPECGNWPAKTADECTFCKRRDIASPQEPPDDPRIFNRRQPGGTFRPVSRFFDEAAWEYLEPIERAQLQRTRPDMFPEGISNDKV